MARKKKQEVILLHGNSQFNMAAAEAVSLKQGELVIEHGKINVNGKDEAVTKIHTIDNTGAELATFIDQKAINELVNAVDTKVDTLEDVVGNAEDGLVKDVATNAAAISDLQAALGMGGTSGTGVTARVKALEDAVGNASVKDDSGNTVTEATGLFADVEANTAAIASQGGRLTTVEGKAEANANEITALKETVNGDGDDNKGLVGDVEANAAAIAKNAADITELEKTVHGYDEPVEGGEEGATEHVAGLVDRVTVLEDLIGDADGKGSIVDRVADAESKITNLETLVGSETDGLVKDVDDLQATVGDATKGLVKDVAANKTATETNATAIDGLDKIVNGYTPKDGEKVEGLVDKVAANKTAIEGLKTQISTDIATELGKLDVTAGDEDKAVTKYVSYVEQTDGKISAHYETLDAKNVAFTPAEPAGTLSGITTVKGALDKLNAQDVVLAGDIEAVDARIDALLGKTESEKGDDGKTIRAIANEELAKQLIPENAADALNSLEEIAAWIQAHPEDAAAMNLEIENLQSVVANVLEDFVTVTTDDDKETIKTLTAVKKIKDSLQILTNKDTELDNAITALTETVNANKDEIGAYTVNNKAISGNPVLDSTDIKMTAVVGAEQGVTEQTIQEAIAQVQTNVNAVDTKVNAVDTRINTLTFEGGEHTNLVVTRTADKFTFNLNVIDAGSYDDDTTEA